MTSASNLQGLIESSLAPETPLPESRPLTLTRNFVWVVAFCVVSLLTVPVVVAWTASLILK